MNSESMGRRADFPDRFSEKFFTVGLMKQKALFCATLAILDFAVSTLVLVQQTFRRIWFCSGVSLHVKVSLKFNFKYCCKNKRSGALVPAQ